MSHWKVLKSQELFKAGFFRLRVDECELPDRRIMPRYYVMEFADWVNVVALTREQKIVLVEQYRHGAQQSFLEIPGGSTDSFKEEPLLAGQRELLEETGYRSDEWIYCGFHFPNPALQSNKMHTFLALACEKVREPELDPFEDLVSSLMDVREAYARLERGEIQHSLIASSMHLARRFLVERQLL